MAMMPLMAILKSHYPAPDPAQKRVGNGSCVTLIEVSPPVNGVWSPAIFVDEWGQIGSCPVSDVTIPSMTVQEEGGRWGTQTPSPR